MNKKIYLVIGILIIFTISIFSILPNLNTSDNLLLLSFSEGPLIEEEIVETYILGYCPTMELKAIELKNNNEFLILKKYQTTSEVINALNNNKIDIALVGRIVKENELQNPYEIRLNSGLTLVGKTKHLILETQLINFNIHTAINKNEVENYITNMEKVVFYNSDEEAIKNGFKNGDIVLIDWEDYEDYMELIVPIDITGDKIEKFRIPTLYSKTKITYLQ